MRKPMPEEYDLAVIGILKWFAPKIYPCHKCGWPVVEGYVCNYCQDQNPSEPAEETTLTAPAGQ